MVWGTYWQLSKLAVCLLALPADCTQRSKQISQSSDFVTAAMLELDAVDMIEPD